MPNRPDPTTPARAGARTIHALPAGLERLPWELPRVFLGLDGAQATPEGAATWILPVPYEATTSWGSGTRQGPRAVIDASRYIELHDHELGRDPSIEGVYTFPALELARGDAARAMAELEDAFTRILDAAAGRRVIMLGGEHSVSAPAILAHARRLPQRPSVLQLDAHLDLRATLDGSPYSHACAMGRVVDRVDLVTVGARGISGEEWEIAGQSDNVTVITGEEVARAGDWMDRALDALGDPVYITFDVDFFDPALVPSTGTPEPGGGDWHTALALLRRVFAERRVVGADVVEHAPIPGMAAPDFLVARLVYKMIGYWSGAGTRP
ncbi:MAG: agmatinase [Gemmatimonadota bacterium]|nr:agmatinase [Gemmatimonadota bacterium]MDE2984211.1 agmatinase [Gemmatimonadota bacterium]